MASKLIVEVGMSRLDLLLAHISEPKLDRGLPRVEARARQDLTDEGFLDVEDLVVFGALVVFEALVVFGALVVFEDSAVVEVSVDFGCLVVFEDSVDVEVSVLFGCLVVFGALLDVEVSVDVAEVE